MKQTLFIVYHILLTLTVVESSVEFKVTHWTECPKWSRHFRKFVGVSVEQCVDECTRRPSCRSVGYKRRVTLCEVHLEETTFEDTADDDGSCIFIKKDDMTRKGGELIKEEMKGHVYDVSTGKYHKECDAFNLEHGKVYGNRRYLGAKVAFKCDAGYNEKTGEKNAVCKHTGEWSYTPECESSVSMASQVTSTDSSGSEITSTTYAGTGTLSSATTTYAGAETLSSATTTTYAGTETLSSATTTTYAGTETLSSATTTYAGAETLSSATTTTYAGTETLSSATTTYAGTETLSSATTTYAGAETLSSATTTIYAGAETLSLATTTTYAGTETLSLATPSTYAGTETLSLATTTYAGTETLSSATMTAYTGTETFSYATTTTTSTTTTSAVTPSSDCKEGKNIIPFEDHTMSIYISRKKKTHDEAERCCTENQGSLVIISYQEKYDFIKANIPDGKGCFWIDGKRDKDGVQFLKTIWNSNAGGGYEKNWPYIGVVVGRVAGRIADGKFNMDGKEYKLAINNGPNNIHGGVTGFSRRLWDGEITGDKLKLTYTSPDGEDGFPGEVTTTVMYSLTPEGALTIDYVAGTTKPCPLILTNHSYFNLKGHTDDDVFDHVVQINADACVPLNEDLIPTGDLPDVTGTPNDLRTPVKLGDREDQVRLGNLDLTYCVGNEGELKYVSRVSHPATGRYIDTHTTEPGLQFYTAKYMADAVGKGGKAYQPFASFCLETQRYPDSVNHSNFPNCILRPGYQYKQTTVFTFGVLQG